MQRVNRKAMSSLLQSTLEAVVDVDKFPKASVDVNVLVLQVCKHKSCCCLPAAPVST
jgi:ribonuclease PH